MPITLYILLSIAAPEGFPPQAGHLEQPPPLFVGNIGWARVWSVAFSPDGKQLAAVGELPTPTVWDTSSGKERSKFTSDGMGAHANSGAAFLPDNRTLLVKCTTGEICEWDVTKQWQAGVFARCDRNSTSIALVPNGKLLAYAEGRLVVLREVRTREVTLRLQHRDATMTALAFASDNQLLATGDSKGQGSIWDPEMGKLQHRFSDSDKLIDAVEFSRDKRYLVTHNTDDAIIVWDRQLGKKVHTLQGQYAVVTADSNSLIVSTRQGIKVADLATGKVVCTVSPQPHIARAMALSPDGTKLAIGADDGVVRLWDITSWLEPKK